MQEKLKNLHAQLETIRAEWDGEEAGTKEDRASSAEEAQSYIDRLLDIMDYLKL